MRTRDEDAADFLRRLCRLSPGGTGELAISALENHFWPERIKVFVTSAIGFHVNQLTSEFDHNDRANYYPDAADPRITRIRGAIFPINVAEPLLWLGDQLNE
jgi:hypothetical protein